MADLEGFARTLLEGAGMPADKAGDVAAILVEGDRLGKTTHGLAALAPYLREIESGGMAVEGGPAVIRDHAACLTWDGRRLPGPWLMLRAVDEAIARAGTYGMGAVAVQRSHHTACLGTYARRAVERGYLLLLTLTDPGHSSVAPFGGSTPVLTSNPIAFGAPMDGPPILIDMATALLTNAAVAQAQKRGEPLASPDLLDNQGRPSADPAVMAASPPGTILPLGGVAAGHKGSAISLMVELLTGCLSGHGRAFPREGWGASVFLLALDPEAFGGRAAYRMQAEHLADLCRASTVRPGFDRVVLPGEAAIERFARSAREGLAVADAVLEPLRPFAAGQGVAMPEPLSGGGVA
ncbi:Ldh family oxidoreductase [Marinivivus vitaminiproducens]|uniref:Ldh family oxidoreductase n=1 Tax=Marinivivus vitaminiproducens TaxID=3035935 RepID=UPI0027A5F3F1|nr:Ldh family oxidoreductase [Geminicoccaceae bacterium SCSIO 64248]